MTTSILGIFPKAHQRNWQVFHEFLPASVCIAITEFLPPSIHEDDDYLVWTPSANGLFSFSSALSIVENTGTVTYDKIWSKIWKLRAPERIKSFLWLAAHERLPTNNHCMKCKVIASDLCSRCGEEAETTIHALRDCFYAKSIWSQIVPQGVLPHFLSLPICAWINFNLSYSHHSSSNPTWPLIFSVASWLIWRWRNNSIFQDAPAHGTNKVAVIMQTAREFWFTADTLSISRLMKGRQEDKWIRWIPPIPGYLKLNCDASISPITGNAVAAGIFRNADGQWVSGFITNLGIKHDWEAELEAIIMGLKMAAVKGWNHILVDSDANLVVQGIKTDSQVEFNHPLYTQGKRLLQSMPNAELAHSYREANRAADMLAKIGHSFPLGYHVIQLPPSLLSNILEDDRLGLCTFRPG